MIPLFAFNNKSYHYAIEHFYSNYVCKWIPQEIPTLTIASEYDFICPTQIFVDNTAFQRNNMTHRIINNAGHCP